MKKILLTGIFLFCYITCHAWTAIDDFYYELNEETMEAEVAHRTRDLPGSGYSIPETVTYQDKTYTVTSIKARAFINSFMMYIYIPKTIKSIGKDAFRSCMYLTRTCIYDLKAWCNIKFADETANPGHLYLINGTTSSEITDLVIPEDVTKINDYAFYSLDLFSVTMPETLTTIGNYAFGNCKNLTSINIPKS